MVKSLSTFFKKMFGCLICHSSDNFGEQSTISKEHVLPRIRTKRPAYSITKETIEYGYGLKPKVSIPILTISALRLKIESLPAYRNTWYTVIVKIGDRTMPAYVTTARSGNGNTIFFEQELTFFDLPLDFTIHVTVFRTITEKEQKFRSLLSCRKYIKGPLNQFELVGETVIDIDSTGSNFNLFKLDNGQKKIVAPAVAVICKFCK